MENVLAVKWFRDIFLKWRGLERPQILIMDQDHRHEVLDLLMLAREERIVILGCSKGQKLLWPPYKALQHSMFAIHVERPKLYGV